MENQNRSNLIFFSSTKFWHGKKQETSDNSHYKPLNLENFFKVKIIISNAFTFTDFQNGENELIRQVCSLKGHFPLHKKKSIKLSILYTNSHDPKDTAVL